MKKRLLSLLLVLMFAFTCFPVNVFAVDSIDATINVESVTAAAGATVDVNVKISNNPGIAGATFSVGYHKDLTLIDAANGTAFDGLDYTQAGTFTNPCKFAWDSENTEATADGVLLKLTFKVADTAEKNAKLNVDVTYRYGDVYSNEKDIELKINNGAVMVLDYIPGDVYEDGVINSKDTRLIRQYITGGYDITINEAAADVNDDGVINTKDTRLIRRYITGGYDVVLLPSTPKCQHSMKATAKVDATCTEDGNIAYWYCTECDKCFTDEEGIKEISLEDTVIKASHTLEHFDAKAATTKEQGCVEHWKCSACGKYFSTSEATRELSKVEVFIPVIESTKSSVVYNLYGSDPYLESVGVDNTMNPTSFNSEDGLVLNDVIAPSGYTWKGWSTADGTPISEIAPHSTSRQIVLNANWDKITYRINFDTPDVPVKGNKITGEEVTNYTEYTVDTGITLNNPHYYGYTFVGWSNDDGFLVKSIEPGTIGNLKLHANWTSNRNRATSYADYGEPVIIEDDNNGQFLFVYDIGRIDNVPLSTYIDETTGTAIGANGTALNIDMEYSVKEEFNKSSAEGIIKNVADATTRSSGWTLSEEWNNLYEESTGYEDKQIKTEERTDSQGNVVGGNFFVSNSQGGSSFVSTESGGSSSNSSKVTTDNSYGINTSYDKSTEKYCDAKLGVSNKTEVSAGVEIPIKIAKVSAGVKNTTTVSAEVSSGRKDNEAFHVDQSLSSYVGTVDTNSSSSYYNTVANQSSNWNSTSGYEKSYQTSIDTSVRKAVASEISKTTKYNISKALGGENSKSETVSGTTTSENGYSNTLTVSEYSSKTTTKKVKYSNSDIGYYRVVTAGTIHVYGVVGYDIATSSYYTYTYNVLSDDTFEYVDFSKERATFDDCENGVVTFEVPYEVNEYVLGVTSETEGLEIGLDGTVNGFETPEDFDGTVVVPQYHAETQPGSDNIAIKTKAFSSTAFRNNTDIETVILPVYITEIPDNAFEGCTNLKTVVAYGVTKIGANAFKGCTSLEKFSIDNCVTGLGNNAFENVCEIEVMAYDSMVADAAIDSGADRITVDISKIKDTYDNKTVVVNDDTDYFAIIGNGGEYKNLEIESAAKETLISKIKFVNNTDTPLKISSSTVTLSIVSVENAPVYALHLSNENTHLKLYGEINLSSSGDNTVISKNVALGKANNSITSKLNITGGYLVCGEVVNKETYLNVEPTPITSEEYDMYTSPCVLTYDTNGGVEIETKKIVYKGQKYGELPTPEREHFEFTGWYTAKEDGELVTANSVVNVISNQTLYAQWKALTANLIFETNGGEVSSKSKLVYIGTKIGELPVPTRENFTFDGWFTEDGTEVTSETVFTTPGDITLRAYWISDWVKVSEILTDGEVVNEKWSYDLTSYTNSSSSTMNGWTLYNTTWVWGSYGSWSSWSKTAVAASDSRQVETKTVTDRAGYTNYKYWIYRTSDGWGYGTQNYYTGASHGSCTIYDEINLSYSLPVHNSSLGTYGPYNSSKFSHSGDSYWFSGGSSWVPAVTHTEYRYRERSKVYTYYFKKTDSLEAATDPTGQSNVTNVQKLVQYRVK